MQTKPARRVSKNRGENVHTAALTEATVREARLLHETGQATVSDLARRHGVARITMEKAIRRETWRHVP